MVWSAMIESGGDGPDERTSEGGRDAGDARTQARGPDAAADAGRHDPRGAQAGERLPPPLPPLTRDPATYTVADEPIGDDEPVDWRHLYELAAAQLDREEDNGRTIDAKAATLFAGVVASIGFSFRLNETLAVAVGALLYLIPLMLLLSVYLTRVRHRAPRAEALREFFPRWPVTTLVAAIDAMIDAEAFNERINEAKAVRFDRALVAAALATVVMLAVQLAAAFGRLRGYPVP